MTATALVDAHVRALGRALRGPGSVRRSMLREVHDGLRDATAAHVDAGLPATEAAGRAVAEFGTIDELAAEYQAELTARQGRASALLVMLIFPATSLGWELMWRSGVTWTSDADSGTSALVRALAGWEDVGAVATAAVAALLLACTFLRRIPPRRVTVLVGITAGLGGLVEAGLAVAMTVLNGRSNATILTSSPTAIPAYLISGLVLVVVLGAAARSVRSAFA